MRKSLRAKLFLSLATRLPRKTRANNRDLSKAASMYITHTMKVSRAKNTAERPMAAACPNGFL
jgi:hypothetical protein